MCLHPRARLAEGHEEALKRELGVAQDRELAMQNDMTGLRAKIDDMTGKVARFDAIAKRASELQEAHSESKHRADAMESSLKATQAEKVDLARSHTELLQKVTPPCWGLRGLLLLLFHVPYRTPWAQVELLQVDKNYLQKSVADATERVELLRAEVSGRP